MAQSSKEKVSETTPVPESTDPVEFPLPIRDWCESYLHGRGIETISAFHDFCIKNHLYKETPSQWEAHFSAWQGRN